MKNLDEREYNNVYAIPANYTDSGKLLGGMIDTRNAIETVILVLALGYPELILIPMPGTIRIVVMTVTLLPLAVVLFILIILHPYAPKVLNNVGFAYLTVACIDAETFAANLPRFFFVYIVGSLVFNGVCILLMKPAKALAAKTVKA